MNRSENKIKKTHTLEHRHTNPMANKHMHIHEQPAFQVLLQQIHQTTVYAITLTMQLKLLKYPSQS